MTLYLNEDKINDTVWVGSPACEDPGELEQLLIDNRGEIRIVATIDDDDACYNYDDFALILFRGDFYLLQTAGCSCPSPSETWRVDIGPATLDEIETFLRKGKYEGYTVPKRQMEQFLGAIQAARQATFLGTEIPKDRRAKSSGALVAGW